MAIDYTGLITSQHRNKAKFSAMVAVVTQAFGAVTDALESMPDLYDIDAAEGRQLDVIGEWVGIGRTLVAPIPNTFFSWDTTGKGWNEGYWKAAYAPVDGVVSLDDKSYRSALKLKILCNHFDGTFKSYMSLPVQIEGSSTNTISIKDNQDMSIDVKIKGKTPSLFFRAALEQNGFIPRPMGVKINSYTYTA